MTVRKLPKYSSSSEVPESHSRRVVGVEQEIQLSPEKPSKRTLIYALTKPRHVEGYVTRTELAAECGIQAQLARLYLQRAGVKKPTEGWRWKEGSRGLWKARVALGLKP